MSLPVQRDSRGRALPGISLNPGGRPGGIAEVRALLKPHVQAFVKELVGLLKSDSEATRLAAIAEFMNRYLGKPMQSVESDVRTFDMASLYLLAVQAANPPRAEAIEATAINGEPAELSDESIMSDLTPPPEGPKTIDNSTDADDAW